jgi:hypothetical protein
MSQAEEIAVLKGLLVKVRAELAVVRECQGMSLIQRAAAVKALYQEMALVHGVWDDVLRDYARSRL